MVMGEVMKGNYCFALHKAGTGMSNELMLGSMLPT